MFSDEEEAYAGMVEWFRRFWPYAGDPDIAADNVFAFLEKASPLRPLPSRRPGYTRQVKIAGHDVILRTGEYADGTLGEIDIDSTTLPPETKAAYKELARNVSIGLQRGVPLKAYVDACVFSQGGPVAGIVQGDDEIGQAKSISAYIFRRLAIDYLGYKELATKRLSGPSMLDSESEAQPSRPPVVKPSLTIVPKEPAPGNST